MYKQSLDGSKILIVSGYTDQENLLRANEKTRRQVATPPSFFFDAKNMSFNHHRAKREEFLAADGKHLPRANCDEYAELTVDIFVHQNLSNTKGNLVIDSQTREIRVLTTDNSIPDPANGDGLLLGRYIRPEEFTDEYIAVRQNFFDDLDQRPLTIVSQLFPALPAAYITDYKMNINEGEEEATYTVTFSEVASATE